MVQRSVHYEAAFEDYLRAKGWSYVAVDEAKRAIFADAAINSFDFLVYSGSGANLLVDVKGGSFLIRAPADGEGPDARGKTGSRGRTWRAWWNGRRYSGRISRRCLCLHIGFKARRSGRRSRRYTCSVGGITDLWGFGWASTWRRAGPGSQNGRRSRCRQRHFRGRRGISRGSYEPRFARSVVGRVARRRGGGIMWT